jgi:L-threonylcarbamoyladenylate synthase
VGKLIRARERFGEDQIAELHAGLEGAGVVCMATDTVYGLNCLAGDGRALNRLSSIKGSRGRPFLLLIGEISWLEQLVARKPPCASRLIERYWPGPLTLVLNAADGVQPELRGSRGTVAVRQPGSALCRQLLLSMGRPLASSSANVEGGPPCLTGKDAARAFLERVDFVVDSGKAPAKLPSTIVDLTLATPTVVREGALRVDGSFLEQLNAG